MIIYLFIFISYILLFALGPFNTVRAVTISHFKRMLEPFLPIKDSLLQFLNKLAPFIYIVQLQCLYNLHPYNATSSTLAFHPSSTKYTISPTLSHKHHILFVNAYCVFPTHSPFLHQSSYHYSSLIFYINFFISINPFPTVTPKIAYWKNELLFWLVSLFCLQVHESFQHNHGSINEL